MILYPKVYESDLEVYKPVLLIDKGRFRLKNH